jgi:hypothetical protein
VGESAGWTTVKRRLLYFHIYEFEWERAQDGLVVKILSYLRVCAGEKSAKV